jgi:excinuclease ABC subunit A
MKTATGGIRIRGARTHNLQGLNLDLPPGRLTVITGPSGSGKSSLAFDTIYAEGRRRYLETLRADARALFDQLRRPDVDLIDGLPPTLCVAQNVVAARPRSTLATVTEIHDHLRLLWARLGTPHCPNCGVPIARHTVAEIVRATLAQEEGRKLYVLAPLVQDRPGDHRELFQHIRASGFLRARVDGVLTEVRDTPKLNPKDKHTVEMVVDRLVLRPTIEDRLRESIQTAVKHAGGRVIVTDIDTGDWRDVAYTTQYVCPRCGTTVPDPEPRRLYFNNPYGACPRCTGLGQVWEFDPRLVVPDRSWPVGRVLGRLVEHLPPETDLPALDRKFLKAIQDAYDVDVQAPLADWPAEAFDALLYGTDQPGLIPQLRNLAATLEADDDPAYETLLDLAGFVTCPDCHGARLNAEARAVRFAGRGIHEVTALTVADAAAWFADVAGQPEGDPARRQVRDRIVGEVLHRLRFQEQVGLGYLTLDRPAPTLSGGEAQRARLATHLGGGLLGVCYVLDEPTMGLHPRDTDRLIAALRALQARGNTVLVVEHDAAVMRAADHLVDIGPGAGRDGGRLLATGTVADVLANPASVTAPYLRESRRQLNATPLPADQAWLTVRGARAHNLKNLDAAFPLGRWTCVTGVSGSGKSTLARDVFCHAARRHLGLIAPPPGACDGIDGLDRLDKVIEVDQKPLGRSARSTPATYVGAFDEIRKVFAGTRLAKIRGYKASRFSFNVRGGRCDECQGQGQLRVALHVLPDLTVPCPVCQGRRFNRPTLDVHFRGRSIADVLALPVAEALDVFANVPAIRKTIQPLADVGLGYLPLGQPASTLSGGEAQRVKLAAELARPATGRTLYLLDEPTTGLHFADVANLIRVLRQLVDAGNTLVVIEHHPDLIAAADWVLDLGPDGGTAGGHLLAAGTPADIARDPASVTGRYLAPGDDTGGRAARSLATPPDARAT